MEKIIRVDDFEIKVNVLQLNNENYIITHDGSAIHNHVIDCNGLEVQTDYINETYEEYEASFNDNLTDVETILNKFKEANIPTIDHIMSDLVLIIYTE